MGIKMAVYDPPRPDFPFVVIAVNDETGEVLVAEPYSTAADAEIAVAQFAAKLQAEGANAEYRIVR